MDYTKLEQEIGYTFQDKNLLQTALTHTSYAYERKTIIVKQLKLNLKQIQQKQQNKHQSIQKLLRDIMFEIPSNPKIEKCIVTKETVQLGEPPKVIINNNREDKKTVKRIMIQKEEL